MRNVSKGNESTEQLVGSLKVMKFINSNNLITQISRSETKIDLAS